MTRREFKHPVLEAIENAIAEDIIEKTVSPTTPGNKEKELVKRVSHGSSPDKQTD